MASIIDPSKISKHTHSYLTGKLLIATPALTDSCFEKSVIYILAHDNTGAMGLVINHVINNTQCSTILNHLNIDCSGLVEEMPIHFGGPIESTRGFVLHTSDYSKDAFQLDLPFSLSSNVEILKEIGAGKGPSKKIFALGYAGWEAGQLDQEVKENQWIVVPASEEIIFEIANHTKWMKAAESIGIDIVRVSPFLGHA